MTDDLLLQPRELSMLVGSSASGKSFLGIDLACSVAKGLPWIGWATEPGVAVYVHSHLDSFSNRVHAWSMRKGPISSGLFSVPAKGLDLCLMGPGLFASYVSDMIQGAPALVVVDSFTELTASATSLPALHRAVDQLDVLMENGAHVMIICHQRKITDTPRGRGAIASRANVILTANSTEDTVERGDVKRPVRELQLIKRTLALAERRYFELVPVPVGLGSDRMTVVAEQCG